MIRSLSIIFPVFNEELRLKSSFIHIKNFIKKQKKLKIEIIFVDDGSKDNSYYLISKFIKSFKIKKKTKFKVIQSKINLGKGAAIQTSLKYITGDIIIIQDADLEYDPFDYNKLLAGTIDTAWYILVSYSVNLPKFKNYIISNQRIIFLLFFFSLYF